MDTLPDFNKTVCAMLEVASILENGPRDYNEFRNLPNGVIQKISLYLAADFLISYADFWTFRGRFTQGAVSFTTFSAHAGVSSWAID